MIIESTDRHSKGNSNLRMWILLGIFLILAGLFVYDHFHQENKHKINKPSSEERADY